MPSSSRPKGSLGPPRPPSLTPMSERQQLALVMQLSSQAAQAATTSATHGTSRGRDRNERGETPLHIASIRGDHEKVKKLLDQGTDPNITDFAGWTPLHEACFNGWLEIAATLVDAGANINARGYDNDTPLHDAAISGKLNLVKYLLSVGADPFCKNINGKLPFDVARPPAHSYLACITESATSHRIPQAGRSRDDNKKVVSNEETPAAGCGTVIMEALNKNSEEKIESKETTVASNNDKAIASAVVVKHTEGESSTSASSTITSASQEEPSTSTNQKRTFADTAEHPDADTFDDEASKRKKRKDPEPVKETIKASPQSRVVGRGSISGNKPPGPASKTGVAPLSKGGGPLQAANKSNVTSSSTKTAGTHGANGITKGSANTSSAQGKSVQGAQSGKATGQGKSQNATLSIAQVSVKGAPDKKSPCASPKPSAFVKDNDADVEETKVDVSGPKVPPLKIVIPGGVGGGGGSGGQQEGEGGSTQRGGAKNRGGSSTLPYIIHFNINAAGETVPVDGNESWADGKDEKRQSGSEDKTSGSAQRVLRSHRNTDGERDKERGRASPHVSATPCSPSGAPIPTKTPPPYHSSRQSPDTNDSGTDVSHVTNNSGGGSSSSSGGSSASHSSAGPSQQPCVELHPRKRKLKASKESHAHQSATADSAAGSSSESHTSSHTHSPQNNPYQMFLNIQKQIERRQKGYFPVQPKPPQGFKDYLMNRCTYVLKNTNKQIGTMNPPLTVQQQMREEFIFNEGDRHSLRVQHLVEKEKLVLAVEQEILRVHGRAARALANQALPFSVCTLLKDDEVYNMLTAEQEEKERNAQRSRYNGRLFLSWLQDVDDKWEKIKEGMVRRHHTEAESLHATQVMSWEWKLKELGLCDHKSTPFIDNTHVPMVHVSDDFDLLPA